MTSNVRLRYAPSPTGEPHLGNIRTALFNWLYARSNNGDFIIRVEDTDQARKVTGSTESTLDALRWLGIDWDEGPDIGGSYGPYFQSERLNIYQHIVNKLLSDEHAYYCYCSSERLDNMRKEQVRNHMPPGYDRYCRYLTTKEVSTHIRDNPKPVVRFKMSESGIITLSDLIRGKVTWKSELLDDFVILKSDSFPTYHLASVIDDHEMKISHVLRAEEWLPSTPKHIQLYRALNYELPVFGHLPMILGEDKSKLSKRHGAVSILEYRDQGFLPEAVINFLCLLGWSLDDQTEIMSRQTLIKNFSANRVTKSGAIFNPEKLLWMNGMYIRSLETNDLLKILLNFWESHKPEDIPDQLDQTYLLQIIPLIKERFKTLTEAASLMTYFFEEQLDYKKPDLIQKGAEARKTESVLSSVLSNLNSLETFKSTYLEDSLRTLAEYLSMKPRDFFGLLRFVITGKPNTPPLFDTMETLGRARCIKRISYAIDLLTR